MMEDDTEGAAYVPLPAWSNIALPPNDKGAEVKLKTQGPDRRMDEPSGESRRSVTDPIPLPPGGLAQDLASPSGWSAPKLHEELVPPHCELWPST